VFQAGVSGQSRDRHSGRAEPTGSKNNKLHHIEPQVLLVQNYTPTQCDPMPVFLTFAKSPAQKHKTRMTFSHGFGENMKHYGENRLLPH